MRYTLNKIMSWEPCYSRKQVRRLMGRKKSVTLADILCCDDLPDYDAVWVATRIMDDRNNRLFACDCAESVLYLSADPRCANAIRVARRFADGLATADELWSARAAADAAYAAANSAANSAAATAADSAADSAAATAADAANAANAANAAADAAEADAANAAAYAAVWATKALHGSAFWAARSLALQAHRLRRAANARSDQRQALLMLALAGEIE